MDVSLLALGKLPSCREFVKKYERNGNSQQLREDYIPSFVLKKWFICFSRNRNLIILLKEHFVSLYSLVGDKKGSVFILFLILHIRNDKDLTFRLDLS